MFQTDIYLLGCSFNQQHSLEESLAYEIACVPEMDIPFPFRQESLLHHL